MLLGYYSNKHLSVNTLIFRCPFNVMICLSPRSQLHVCNAQDADLKKPWVLQYSKQAQTAVLCCFCAPAWVKSFEAVSQFCILTFDPHRLFEREFKISSQLPHPCSCRYSSVQFRNITIPVHTDVLKT